MEQGPMGRNEKLSRIKELLGAIKQAGSDPKKGDEVFRNAKEAKRIFDELSPTDQEAQQIGFKTSQELREELWSWLD